MTSPAQQALAILERQTCGQPRCACRRSLRRGSGLTHCPVHQDPHPSFNVTLRDQQLLVHCQASCAQAEVIAALRGLQLWPETGTPPDAHRNGHPTREILATYDYRDERGKVLHQTVRYFPKEFRQRRPDGHGGWIWKLADARLVLYRLPELLAADVRQPVFVVEGEKDADRLCAAGLVATCSAMGAGKWRAEYAEALRDRRVIVLPDQDAPGRQHAQQIRQSLDGVAASVRTIELGGLAEHGDVSDWLDAGHTLTELLALVGGVPRGWNAAALLEATLPEPRWAVPEMLTEGLAVLAGRPKFGKSWVALQLALGVAYGGRVFSQIAVEPGDALYVALEDNERRLQKRLRLLVRDGPKPTRLDVCTAWPRLDEGGADALEAWLDAHPTCRLVVIDTWTLIRPRPHRGVDAYFDDTSAARRLKELADRRHVAIVAIHHTRKPFLGGSIADFLDEVLGTSGLTAVADTVLVLQRKRGERDAVLHMTGRDILEEARALEWDDLTGWSLGGDAEEARLSRERRDVLQAVKDAGRAVTPSELAHHLGRNLNTVKWLLWKLSQEGRLLVGKGHYDVPTRTAEHGGLVGAKTTNPANPPTLISNPVGGSDAPPTEVARSDARVGAVGEVGRVGRVGAVGGFDTHTQRCRACGGELGRFERHWPWLHDDCRLPLEGVPEEEPT